MFPSAEEALCLWAAKRFSLPLDEIDKVVLEHSPGIGGGCPTCGYNAGECDTDVFVYFKKTSKRQSEGFEVTAEFGELFREVLEFSTPVDVAASREGLLTVERDLTR